MQSLCSLQLLPKHATLRTALTLVETRDRSEVPSPTQHAALCVGFADGSVRQYSLVELFGGKVR